MMTSITHIWTTGPEKATSEMLIAIHYHIFTPYDCKLASHGPPPDPSPSDYMYVAT